MKLNVTWAILASLALSVASCTPPPDAPVVTTQKPSAASTLSSSNYPNVNLRRAPSSPALSQTIAKLKSDEGIELLYGADIPHSSNFTYTLAQPSDQEEIRGFAAMLAEELAKYPRGCFKKMHLEKIDICKDVVTGGIGGGGFPDAEHNTMFFGFDMSEDNDAFQRHCVHHELLHYMMLLVNGYAPDKDWASLNPPGFKYGTGGRYARSSNSSVLNHPKLGFVDGYAESAEPEDMAEIQACRMMPQEFALLKSWMVKDRYLQFKYQRLLAILQPLGV
jgi:hypothetical protein